MPSTQPEVTECPRCGYLRSGDLCARCIWTKNKVQLGLWDHIDARRNHATPKGRNKRVQPDPEPDPCI